MSREPKNNEEGFMYKLASFIVDKRNLIFLIVAIGLVFSVFSRNWVQVENQLSAYLPKDSETYKGLHLMEDEFITFGTAKVMLVNVTYDEAQAVSERLEAVDGVQSVTFDDTKEHYTNASALYNITFDYSDLPLVTRNPAMVLIPTLLPMKIDTCEVWPSTCTRHARLPPKSSYLIKKQTVISLISTPSPQKLYKRPPFTKQVITGTFQNVRRNTS